MLYVSTLKDPEAAAVVAVAGVAAVAVRPVRASAAAASVPISLLMVGVSPVGDEEDER